MFPTHAHMCGFAIRHHSNNWGLINKVPLQKHNYGVSDLTMSHIKVNEGSIYFPANLSNR